MTSSSYDTYPSDYRHAEIAAITRALRAGECVLLLGLSGAGKSNLMGFLCSRVEEPDLSFALVDGNRNLERTATGMFRLACATLGGNPGTDPLAGLEEAVGRQLAEKAGRLAFLFDRYDTLEGSELEITSLGLRALRDANKYQLTYVVAARRPLPDDSELAELFYGNTIWLGPLDHSDAVWSASRYANRHGLDWPVDTLEQLVNLSGGYPSLLRACCEAYASGAPLEMEAMRSHPVIKRRVKEFWDDHPDPNAIRLSRLTDYPLLFQAETAPRPELTAGEHRLLVYLESHPEVVCEKDDLIRAVWPEDQVVAGLRDDSLAQLVRRLREKIEPDPSRPVHLLTVPGRGYRYRP